MRLLFVFLVCMLASPLSAQQFASFDKASEPVLNDPHDLTIGPDGRLYVADKFGDRIVVMDAGRIVEEGSHDKLLARGGLYAKYWQRQSGGFISTKAAE